MKNQSNEQAIKNFLKEYPEIFTPREQYQILKIIEGSNGELYGAECIREIYDELGLIPDNKNIYVGFSDIIEKEFGIENKNIVEVGGGHIPRLAKRLEKKQINGKVTVYDPFLSKYEKSSSKLSLIRNKFDGNTKIPEETDLLIGLQPCAAAEKIIEVAFKYNIDFIIALCEGGPHGEWFDFYESDEEWLCSIITRAKRGVEENDMGNLVVEKSLVKYNDSYPVIYNKRKK